MTTSATKSSFLTLALLVFRLRTDHEDLTVAPDDLALVATLLDGRPDLHSLIPHSTRDSTPFQVIWTELHEDLVPGDDANEIHPHLSRDMCQDRVAVLELDLEHRVGEGF